MNINTNRPYEKIVNAADSNEFKIFKSGHRAGMPLVPSTCNDAAGDVVNAKSSNTVDLLDALADSNPST